MCKKKNESVFVVQWKILSDFYIFGRKMKGENK